MTKITVERKKSKPINVKFLTMKKLMKIKRNSKRKIKTKWFSQIQAISFKLHMKGIFSRDHFYYVILCRSIVHTRWNFIENPSEFNAKFKFTNISFPNNKPFWLYQGILFKKISFLSVFYSLFSHTLQLSDQWNSTV